jgi:hypothetical protein
LKRWITKGLVLFAVSLPPAMNAPAEDLRSGVYAEDSRMQRIRSFFRKRKCPAQRYAAEFLHASDRYRLDWRLLPSLALIESSGGKAFTNNNIFGWDSCRQRFSSVQAGIHAVAERLANSPLYQGKSIDDKLKVYNSRPHYRVAVKRVMQQLEF